MIHINAILREGYRIASGKSTTDTRFPEGTIRMQEPFFKERGLDLNEYFDGSFVYGTLNLAIAPLSFSIERPPYSFQSVKWTDVLAAEDFFFIPAEVSLHDKRYKALIYIPDPVTKADNPQAKDILEVIAQPIPNLNYGDKVVLSFDDGALNINDSVAPH